MSLRSRVFSHYFDDNEDLDLNDIPKSLLARAWHLAEDPQSVGYLELIFGGVEESSTCSSQLVHAVNTQNAFAVVLIPP
jgi:uncharacterized protein YfeS